MFIKIIGSVCMGLYKSMEAIEALGEVAERLSASSDKNSVEYWTYNGYYVVYKEMVEDYSDFNGVEVYETWNEIIGIYEDYDDAKRASYSGPCYRVACP